MPNRSGFVDFNQFFGANAAAEEEQLRAAMERAQGLDATADAALRKARDEAAKQAFEGGDANITSVGSYSDYLDAKRNAANAWAAMNAAGADPRMASVRQRLLATSPLGQAAGQAQASRAAFEQRAGAAVEGAAAGGLASRQWQTRLNEKKKAAADAQKAAADEAGQSYLSSLVKGAQGRAAAGGAQLDFVGAYNPYAGSPWAASTGGREAAAARRAGATPEQIRAIWQAYTGKGQYGGDNALTNPSGPDAVMEGAISDWGG